MLNENGNIRLSDLIDIKLLQELQDTFAKTTGMASIAVDSQGLITTPSNFSDFCIEYTSETEEGYRRCEECDIRWGEIAAKRGKPVIYSCHAGLKNFAVPIMIDGKHIASILGGQVLTDIPDEAHLREVAKNLGLNEDKYIDMLKKTKVVPAEIVDAAANLLYLFANTISQIAHKNFTLIKKNEEQTLYKKITEAIRSSLDTEKTLNIIAVETAIIFNVDRVVIVEFPDENDFTNWKIRKEYKRFNDIKSPTDIENYTEAAAFIANYIMSSGKPLVANNVNEFDFDEFIINFYKKLDVKSLVWVPIMSEKQKLWGFITLSAIRNYKNWTEEDISFLNDISNQIYIAINQAELYKKEKVIMEREKLSRKITETIRSSLDLNETLLFISEETSKVFNVQRTSISEFPDLEHCEIHITRMEYKATTEIGGLDTLKYLPEVSEYFGCQILENTEILAIDNIRESGTPDYFKESYDLLGVKSLLVIPIQKEDDKWGVLILSEYNYYRHWTSDEVELAKSIASQIYIAIKHAELYEESKKQIERGNLLRTIIDAIRRTLNLNDTKRTIVSEIGRAIKADRVFLVEFDPETNTPEVLDEYSEYLSSKDEFSFVGFDFSSPDVEFLANIHKQTQPVIAEDIDEFINNNNLHNTETEKWLIKTGMKSGIGIPVFYGKQVYGVMAIHYTKNKVTFDDEQIEFLKTLVNQTGIALYQARLYEKSQRTAKNEKALRKIMLSSVTTFDMKEIINSIVSEEGKLFKADRCFFIEIDQETNSNKPIKDYAEYLSSKDIVSHMDRQPTKSETEFFISKMKYQNAMYSSNVTKEDLPEATRRMLIEDLSVKSYLVIPVLYGRKLYGAIILHYVNDFKEFSQDEIDMALAIANQSAIVIHQAELYELTKIQAEREKISKNIIEILRSSLNKSIIKHLFVRNIGKLFDADIVLFSEFDYRTNMYKPVEKDSEYLSSSAVKSLVGYDWSTLEAKEYIKFLLEKREFHIYSWDEYIQGHIVGQDFIDLFEKLNIKSSYSFPVMYQLKLMGFFSIGFTQGVRRLSPEDISRIRNICSQAGIALYHSNLYEEAQKSVQAHAEFVNRLSGELKEPLNTIAEFSEILSKQEFGREEELKHLQSIHLNAKKLIYFLDDITKDIRTRFDFY